MTTLESILANPGASSSADPRLVKEALSGETSVLEALTGVAAPSLARVMEQFARPAILQLAESVEPALQAQSKMFEAVHRTLTPSSDAIRPFIKVQEQLLAAHTEATSPLSQVAAQLATAFHQQMLQATAPPVVQISRNALEAIRSQIADGASFQNLVGQTAALTNLQKHLQQLDSDAVKAAGLQTRSVTIPSVQAPLAAPPELARLNNHREVTDPDLSAYWLGTALAVACLFAVERGAVGIIASAWEVLWMLVQLAGAADQTRGGHGAILIIAIAAAIVPIAQTRKHR